MTNIKIGSIVEVGFMNDHPCTIECATDSVDCKVIFIYTDFNNFTYYFVTAIKSNNYERYFYKFDESLLNQIRPIYQYSEINNIIDYLNCTYRVVSIKDIQLKRKPYNEDGCKCIKCKEFYQYAVPNQPNNTLICYACKNNTWTKYI